VEWTPQILNTRALRLAMNSNWWGVLGAGFKKRFPRLHFGELFSGIPGSRTKHHAAPYAMTEEFTAVYRMHTLLPDEFPIRRVGDDHLLWGARLKDISLSETRKVMQAAAARHTFSIDDLWYSFGTQNPGAIALGNFPRTLQELHKNGELLDVAAIDILRDRERGVPRYNDFRELLGMPRLRTIDELTPDPGWREKIAKLYHDSIDRVDLQVGLLAEKPPAGFGFSDTAFRIFILMASRRLKSDRFLSADYKPAIYTQEGLDWIERNTMSTVLLRHHPGLSRALAGAKNAFAPWHTSARPHTN